MKQTVFTDNEWREQFLEDMKKAYKTFPIKEEHFGKTFQMKFEGEVVVHTFKIFSISPKARKWHIIARDVAGGSEYKFHKDVLNYLDGGLAPEELSEKMK